MKRYNGWQTREAAMQRYRLNHWASLNSQYSGALLSVRDKGVYVQGYKVWDPHYYVSDGRFALNNNILTACHSVVYLGLAGRRRE